MNPYQAALKQIAANPDGLGGYTSAGLRQIARNALAAEDAVPTFVMRVQLGNDQMHSPVHLAGLLVETAEALQQMHEDGQMELSATLRDLNGNTVGSWVLSSAETLSCRGRV